MRLTSGRCRSLAAALSVVLVASLAVWPGVSTGGLARGTALLFPTPQVTAFLETFVRADGRVSRPDQGNDTVSEGQAYGLLLAQTAGRDDLFRKIWTWTERHLQLANGLLAWRAGPDGEIWDAASASDADLLIAWALLRYRGNGAGELNRAGQRVAAAVLAHEVITDADGMPVLTAGPWATAEPWTLDVSYWSLPTMSELARLTGDRTWQQLADNAVLLVERLSHGGRRLPPDWAELTADGGLRPVAGPPGWPTGGRYGLDAQRTVAWFAASCDPRARAMAARWWRVLREPGRARAMTLHLDGTVLDSTRAVLPLVAAAAAAHAARAEKESRTLLALADRRQREQRGYYGAAWNAFGPVLIDTDVLSRC